MAQNVLQFHCSGKSANSPFISRRFEDFLQIDFNEKCAFGRRSLVTNLVNPISLNKKSTKGVTGLFRLKDMPEKSPEYTAKVIGCYYENHSLKEIAKKFGVTKQAIHVFLTRRGINLKNRNRITVKPFTPKYHGLTTTQRFWRLVDVRSPGECWEWQGSLFPNGYGYFRFYGETYYTHRLSYFLCYRQKPSLWVLHSCDNRRCVNPEHLREGTPADNARDRDERGRAAWQKNRTAFMAAILKGRFGNDKRASSRLTFDQVREIRTKREQGESIENLMREYSLCKSAVSRIIRRVTFSDIN